MALLIRSANIIVLGALVLAASVSLGGQVTAQTVTPPVARVLIYDNAGTRDPGDPQTGQWTYLPEHVTVRQGGSIVFLNPSTSLHPHTVTSITWGGSAFARTLTSGTLFNSSPTPATLIDPGESWTLETASLAPNHYVYYCTLHPWMTGSFTVTPRP